MVQNYRVTTWKLRDLFDIIDPVACDPVRRAVYVRGLRELARGHVGSENSILLCKVK